MEKQYNVEWLAAELRKGLRAAGSTLTIKAIEAAEKHDDEIATRRCGRSMPSSLAARSRARARTLAGFSLRSACRAAGPAQRGRGHRWHDHWVRNITICVLIELACLEFGVRPSRNRTARRANRCRLASAWSSPRWPATRSPRRKQRAGKPVARVAGELVRGSVGLPHWNLRRGRKGYVQ